MTLDIKHCNPNNTHTYNTAEVTIDSGIACAIKKWRHNKLAFLE